MLFNSLQFLIFFPVVTLAYFLIPHRARWVWLLIASYYFYMCWNPLYVLLLFCSTLVTYLSGILIGRAGRVEDEKRSVRLKKWCVALSFLINLGILFFFKYFDFVMDGLAAAFSLAGITLHQPAFDVLLPVGISFYTFQALSYTVDVYRKDIEPERCLGRYALFVSFFPQLVAGPIERSTSLLPQMRERHYFDGPRAKQGVLLMAWGLFQKIVIADRAAIFVNAVYLRGDVQSGAALVLATLLFGVQIYCDFAGYSNIAIGAAQVMGFRLMDNFERPYFAKSIREFWRRWHISLSTWFRDYLYIPLGGGRCSRARRYLNVMVTFLVSGLWHGANITFVIWGGLHGLFQVLGDALRPLRKKAADVLKIRQDTTSHRLLQMGFTYLLVHIAWVFFRADTVSRACGIFRQIFTDFRPHVLFDQSLYMILPRVEWYVLFAAIAVLVVMSLVKRDGTRHVRAWLEAQQIWLRWAVYMGIIIVLLVFGVYGPEFVASDFIYFQF